MESFARSSRGNRIACTALTGLVLLSAWTLPAGRVPAFRVPAPKQPVITAKPVELSQNQVVEICDAVEKGDMRPTSFMLLHPSARPSAVDVRTICGWSARV